MTKNGRQVGRKEGRTEWGWQERRKGRREEREIGHYERAEQRSKEKNGGRKKDMKAAHKRG